MRDDLNLTYKRLTTRDKDGYAKSKNDDTLSNNENIIIERLAILEDMIQNKKLVFVPLKTNDKLYYKGHIETCKGLYYSESKWKSIDIGERLFHLVSIEAVSKLETGEAEENK